MTEAWSKARELAVAAIDAGMSVSLVNQKDTENSPYVTVSAQLDSLWVSATWHTRETGTYRLFQAESGVSRYRAHPTPLKKILELVKKQNS